MILRMRQILILLFFITTILVTEAKTPAETASALVSEFERNFKIWETRYNQATVTEKSRLVAKIPNVKTYGDALLKVINPYLDKDWVVKYMAWLVRNHPELVIEKTLSDGSKNIVDREKIFIKYVDRYHVYSLDAGVFVASLIFSERPDGKLISSKRKLADKVYIAHANKNNIVMGTAALACGHFVPANIDNAAFKKKIGGFYRSAVTHAYDVKLGNRTVGEIVGEKAYILNRLSVGCPVPLFEGYDATQRIIRMVDFKGNPVVICFWSQTMPKFTEFSASFNKFREIMMGKKIQVIGVTNDAVSTTRNLIGAGTVKWRNVMDVKGSVSETFRVKNPPVCYVVDDKGTIVYRGAFGGPLFGTVIESLAK